MKRFLQNGMIKTVLTLCSGILIGAALSGPAAQGAEAWLRAFPSVQPIYLDGQRITLPAYSINGNNYVKLRDVGAAMDFNVYWDGTTGTVQIDSGAPYTGEAPVPAEDLDAVRQEIIRLANEVRRENSAAELTVSDSLMAAAQVCAERRLTKHDSRFECETVLAEGYPHGFGSNLTWFTANDLDGVAEKAVGNWTNSPGHFQTMIDPDADGIGVGVTQSNGVTYCYMFIGRPNTINPYG